MYHPTRHDVTIREKHEVIILINIETSILSPKLLLVMCSFSPYKFLKTYLLKLKSHNIVILDEE